MSSIKKEVTFVEPIQKSKTVKEDKGDNDSNLTSSDEKEEEIPVIKEYTLQEVKELLDQYEEIADKDDQEMNPWQRQIRVNKFMLEMSVR